MTANTLPFWAVLFCGLAIVGCPNTDPDDTAPEGDADADADADGDTDADADTDAEYAIWVHAGTEAAFSLYSEDEPPAPDCEGVIDCWITVPGPNTYTVYGKLEGWIFVPQTIDVTEGNKKPAVDWTSKLGLEGLAPHGYYEDDDEDEVEVETNCGDPDDYYGYDHVYISFLALGGIPNLVTDDQFVGENETGRTVDGTITTDLVIIDYHMVSESGQPFDETLTKID